MGAHGAMEEERIRQPMPEAYGTKGVEQKKKKSRDLQNLPTKGKRITSPIPLWDPMSQKHISLTAL